MCFRPEVPSRTPLRLPAIRVPTAKVDALLKAHLPSGGFMSKHRSGDIPQWITCDKAESCDDYFNKAVGLAKKANARLVYRPSSTAPLGLVGCKVTQGTLAPRWFLAGAPPLWGEDSLVAWATERGFTEVSAVRRHSKKAWFFRARLPDGLTVGLLLLGFLLALLNHSRLVSLPKPRLLHAPRGVLCSGRLLSMTLASMLRKRSLILMRVATLRWRLTLRLLSLASRPSRL